MPRKTDSKNPSDWLWIAESDLGGIRLAAVHEVSFYSCQGKLAEVLEKILKAELIRTGWPLEKTHDLEKLLGELTARRSDIVLSTEPLVHLLDEAYFVTRYPGFDLDDPDWPALREQLEQVTALLATVKARIPPAKT